MQLSTENMHNDEEVFCEYDNRHARIIQAMK